MPAPYQGGCQCREVRYEVTEEPRQIVVCHCADCQRQSGSAFGMTLVVDESAFQITKGEPKTFRSVSESGRVKYGAFCPGCGARIYNRTEWRPGTISVKPGTLDNSGWVEPTVHLWTSNKQAWVTIPEQAEAYETQPR